MGVGDPARRKGRCDGGRVTLRWRPEIPRAPSPHLTLSTAVPLPQAVVILCKHLLHNTAVTSLTVSHNGLTEKCCESLAELLRLNRTLERLDVAHNALAAGGVALAEALKANVGLLHFDLSHCSLDDAAGEALAAAFKGHGTLQGACVGHNDFGEGVCSRLALAFCQNPRMP